MLTARQYNAGRKDERSVPESMAKKPSGLGLGRGLGALLGETALFNNSDSSGFHVDGGNDPDGQSPGVSYLPLTEIENNVNQPRKNFDPDALEELAESIRQHGLIQPLAVRKMPSGYYQIIAGERRWRAARIANLETVPVVIMDVDDRTAAEIAMVENLQREDLNPMEEAAGYRALMDTYHMTQEEAAARVGKSRSAVANCLRLLDLCEPVRTLVGEGKISAGHARTLVPLPEELQRRAADAILRDGLSVRQTERLAKQLMSEQKRNQENQKGRPVQDFIRDPGGIDYTIDYTIEAQKKLSERLGRGVRIIEGRKKGRIELDYYGLEDLNELLDALLLLNTSRGHDTEQMRMRDN